MRPLSIGGYLRLRANLFKQTHLDSQRTFTWISNGTHNLATVTRPPRQPTGVPAGWCKRYVGPFNGATFFSRIKLAFFPTLSRRSLSRNQVLLRSHDTPIGPPPSYLSDWTLLQHYQQQERGCGVQTQASARRFPPIPRHIGVFRSIFDFTVCAGHGAK